MQSRVVFSGLWCTSKLSSIIALTIMLSGFQFPVVQTILRDFLEPKFQDTLLLGERTEEFWFPPVEGSVT